MTTVAVKLEDSRTDLLRRILPRNVDLGETASRSGMSGSTTTTGKTTARKKRARKIARRSGRAGGRVCVEDVVSSSVGTRRGWWSDVRWAAERRFVVAVVVVDSTSAAAVLVDVIVEGTSTAP